MARAASWGIECLLFSNGFLSSGMKAETQPEQETWLIDFILLPLLHLLEKMSPFMFRSNNVR